jgi:hypothetical protein
MRLDRPKAWWLAKADDENETVGAASPRSKKTLTLDLSDEDKARLRAILDEHAARSDGPKQALGTEDKTP